MSRFSKTVLVGLIAVFVASAGLLYLRMRLASKLALPTGKLEISVSDAKREPELPPGEPPAIEFTAPNMSASERQSFLGAEYKISRTVAELPGGIRKLYTVKGESRVAMADPGERFEATDNITDPNLLRRRLIFAGVSQDRAFVHYEEGGIAHSFIVELFRLEPSGIAAGIWHGYCGPAKDLDDIRQLMAMGDN
jgi:hypothetical protein